MIRHIVMFKFMNNADGKTAMENAAEAKARAMSLKEQISEIKNLEVQLNSKSADSSNYEFALICDFESIEDLNSQLRVHWLVVIASMGLRHLQGHPY